MADFTALEPISTGDIIDRAVRIYRRNFVALLTIAAVPCLSYYISSLLFWSGYSKLLLGTISGSPVETIVMLLMGMAGQFVSALLMLSAIAGMSRCIGDYAMLGEPITFRKCVKVVSKRVGDILLMALLCVVFLVVMYVAFIVVFFVLVLIVVFAFGLPRQMGMPAWVSTTIGSVAILAALVLGVIVALIIVSRVIFLPAILMIEGQSAGQSIGRAFTLGGKNWYRIGGLLLFGYFVKLSVAAAIAVPLTIWLGLNGAINADLVTTPTWTAALTGIDQLSGLLVLPIYMISVTLLYFDNRVRKEGYDLELLTIGLERAPQPQFAWTAAPRPVVFSAQSPLGLNQPYMPSAAVSPPGAWPGPSGPIGHPPPGYPVAPSVLHPPSVPQPPVHSPAAPSPSGGSFDASFNSVGSGGPGPGAEAPPAGGVSMPGGGLMPGIGLRDMSDRVDGPGNGAIITGSAASEVTDQACARCGNRLEPHHRFCQMCGQPAGESRES